MSLPNLSCPWSNPNNMRPSLMKPSENGSYALLNQAFPQRQTHHLHPCWSANVPSSHPSSPPWNLCSPNSINSGSIRAPLHVSQLKVKVRWAPKVGRWRLRSQGRTLEPSNFRWLDRLWDLCDRVPEDVSIAGHHGPRWPPCHVTQATVQRLHRCFPPSQERVSVTACPR